MANINNAQYRNARYEFMKKQEGYVPYIYLDPVGKPTMGVGIMLLNYTKETNGIVSTALQEGSAKENVNIIESVFGSQAVMREAMSELSSIYESTPNLIQASAFGSYSAFKGSEIYTKLSKQFTFDRDANSGRPIITGFTNSTGQVIDLRNIYNDPAKLRQVTDGVLQPKGTGVDFFLMN